MEAGPGNRKWEMYVLLALLLVIALFLGLSISKELAPSPSGTPHPEIIGMKAGGDGALRINGLERASFVLFAASFILLSILVVASVSKRKRTVSFWIGIVMITLSILYVWYRVFASYMAYLSSGELQYFLGFPEPTAWMIYGLWGGGALFTLLYVIGFRKFIYSREDEETLKDIVEQYAKDGEEA